MLKARANASYHIGFPDSTKDNGEIKYSYYLGIDSSLPLHGMSYQYQRQHVMSQQNVYDMAANAHFTVISIRRACKMIVKCLENDRGMAKDNLFLSQIYLFVVL